MDTIGGVLINADRKSTMTNESENLNFVGVCLQSESAWVLLQIQSKGPYSERKQTIIIVKGFDRTCQRPLKFSTSSGQGLILTSGPDIFSTAVPA